MFNIPSEVLFVIEKLNNEGFEAYIVGGCVRDFLFGKIPLDYDVATNAKPDQVKKLFDKCIDTGILHGTVTVIINNKLIEVTTYRKEAEYIDFRRPSKVYFINDLYEDLKRRDFTINALAYHPEKGIIDYFDGKNDIKKGLIRCVGDPFERFSEDALRILRAIRFASTLNFKIEPKTLEAVKIKRNLLYFMSIERIISELKKILESDNPLYGINLLKECQIGKIITPYFDEIYEKISNSYFVEVKKELRLPAFFSVIPSSIDVENEMKRLKLDNKSIKIAKNINTFLNKTLDSQMLKRIYFIFGEWSFDIIYTISKLVKKPQIYEDLMLLKNNNHLLSKKDIKINGEDLKKLGFEGNEIKKLLDIVYDFVLKNPWKNQKEILQTYIINYVNENKIKGIN